MAMTRREMVAALCVGYGGISVATAFERATCLGAGGCAPNIFYLVPGLVAVLVGIGLIRLDVLALVAWGLSAVIVLAGGFVLLVEGRSLLVGIPYLVVALLFAGMAHGAEALRARNGQRERNQLGRWGLRGR